jgi:hypothetical protein
MLLFLADENFNNDILRGVLRANSEIDVVRIQDIGLSGADDETVLERAAQENRILLTHDVKTITHYAYQRIEKNLKMPGVFEVKRSIAFSQAIEDILLLAECSFENEWEGQIIYLPLK